MWTAESLSGVAAVADLRLAVSALLEWFRFELMTSFDFYKVKDTFIIKLTL